MIYLYLILIILLSAFFSGTEIAYVSSDRLRLELDKEKGGVSATMLSYLYKHQDQFISTMLVGNNVVLVLYGILMSQLMDPVLERFISIGWVQILINTLISTLLIVVFGEYMPKVYFKRNANSVLVKESIPLFAVYVLLYPIAYICSLLSRFFMLLVRRPGSDTTEVARLSTVDLEHFLFSSGSMDDENNEFNTEVKIIKNVIDFPEVQVRDCMIPRNEVVAVPLSTDKDELRELFISTGLTKIIVYRESIDVVEGYIHSAEMFKETPWQNSLRETIYVPESMYAHKLMERLMKKNKSIAIVIDELGGTSGLVTLEDLVEEIFGEIEDEHDLNRIVAKKIDDYKYVFSGRMEIDDANDRFGLSLPESDDYMTIAGFILDAHPHIPDKGDVVTVGRYNFEILQSSSNRIELVKMIIDSEQ